MEQRLDHLGQATDALPGLGAMAVDVFDERVRLAQARGLDVDASLAALGDLLLQLAEPRSLKVLGALIEHPPKLEPILAQVDQLPGLVAMSVDIVDELIAKAQSRGLRIEDVLRNSLLAASKLVALLESREVHALLESGVLSPETLSVVSEAGRALTTARGAEPGRAGLLALWRASRTPEVQRATDFLLRFASAFGQNLDGAAALPGGKPSINPALEAPKRMTTSKDDHE